MKSELPLPEVCGWEWGRGELAPCGTCSSASLGRVWGRGLSSRPPGATPETVSIHNTSFHPPSGVHSAPPLQHVHLGRCWAGCSIGPWLQFAGGHCRVSGSSREKQVARLRVKRRHSLLPAPHAFSPAGLLSVCEHVLLFIGIRNKSFLYFLLKLLVLKTICSLIL